MALNTVITTKNADKIRLAIDTMIDAMLEEIEELRTDKMHLKN